ncbi:unnamed protein product [Protopolystoma xenopodis]|uniref:Uncharacterized protein n=1 Tax=Protopolystoma xenopodis TaxID=117903 RepID=A0A3S5B2D0_9PLAT|nr:unnamed protein product [Protopolystoma xenopodis]
MYLLNNHISFSGVRSHSYSRGQGPTNSIATTAVSGTVGFPPVTAGADGTSGTGTGVGGGLGLIQSFTQRISSTDRPAAKLESSISPGYDDPIGQQRSKRPFWSPSELARKISTVTVRQYNKFKNSFLSN